MAGGIDESFTVWLTGLSGSGKSTIARLLATELRNRGLRTVVLDGDEVRRNVTRELGFDRQGRDEQVARVGWLCELLNGSGVVAVAALVSPYRTARDRIRVRIERFVEVHVDCPIELLEARDPKGLYQQHHAGALPRLTGIDDPYEPPLHPEVRCMSDGSETPAGAVVRILEQLVSLGYLEPDSIRNGGPMP